MTKYFKKSEKSILGPFGQKRNFLQKMALSNIFQILQLSTKVTKIRKTNVPFLRKMMN